MEINIINDRKFFDLDILLDSTIQLKCSNSQKLPENTRTRSQFKINEHELKTKNHNFSQKNYEKFPAFLNDFKSKLIYKIIIL